jgi:hypothetical protein
MRKIKVVAICDHSKTFEFQPPLPSMELGKNRKPKQDTRGGFLFVNEPISAIIIL